MACNNCENGCVHPQLCACDCTSCAEANSCDIPVGDTGPGGPAGPMGPPGSNGINGTNGTNGADGCSTQNVYVSDGTDGNVIGDVIVTTAVGAPCPNTINAGNLLSIINNNSSSLWPPGVIVMWSGAIASIGVGPLTGWALCDGTNTTPDLRGRFIGAWGGRAVDAPFNGINGSGGSMTVALSQTNIAAHVHGVGGYTATTTILPDSHCHQLWGRNGSGTGVAPFRDPEYGRNANSGWFTSLAAPNAPCNTDQHTHDHVGSNTVLGGWSADGTPALSAPQGTPFSIVPKYWTLAFIMKL